MRKNHLSGNMKRILAIACAAMVAVTSVPANSVAYASETGQPQEENTEGSENGSGENGSGESGSGESGSGESGSGESGSGESGNGDSGSGESGSGESGSGESGSGESGSGESGSGESGSGEIGTGEGSNIEGGESGSDSGEGGGSGSGESGSGESGSGESGSGEGDQPEVKKDIAINFGIDDDASEKTEGKYTKLVFKASAKDKSTLETEIKKIEYYFLDDDGNTEKEGEIKDKDIVIESKDLKKRFKKYTLKITVTDADDEKTEDEKEVEFYYKKPVAEIVISDQSETLKSDKEKYTKLIFSASSEVDDSTSVKRYSYKLMDKEDATIREGYFTDKENATIVAQEMPAKDTFKLELQAEDENGEKSAVVSKEVFMAKDLEGPTIDYEAKLTSGDILKDALHIAQDKILYTITVTDDSKIGLVKYQIINSEGDPEPEETLDVTEKDGVTTAEFDVIADRKGRVKIYAEDEFGNPNDKTTEALVVEDDAPALNLEYGSEDDEKIQKNHSFKISASDLPEVEYSGIQYVTWQLIDSEGNVKDKDTDQLEKPTSLDEVKGLKDYKEKEISVSGEDNNYNGLYTFEFRAVDWSGNGQGENEKKSLTAIFDNTKPDVGFSVNDAFADDDPNTDTSSNIRLNVMARSLKRIRMLRQLRKRLRR